MKKYAGLFFVLPALIFLVVFKIIPIGLSIFESLMQSSFTRGKSFTGLDNYAFLLFEDPVFWNSFKVTIFYSLMVNPLTALLSVIMALLLNSGRLYTRFFRTLFFLPSAVSCVVVSVLWSVILDPYYGMANGMLNSLGMKAQPFFSSPSQALPSLAFLNIWRNSGYWMVFFLAGLKNIPGELYESADIDGASYFNKLFKITLPLLVRTFSFVLIANTAFNFLTFAPVYIITRGGPDGSTNLLMYEAYKSAFINLDMGRANAITTVLLTLILIFSFFELRLSKARFEY